MPLTGGDDIDHDQDPWDDPAPWDNLIQEDDQDDEDDGDDHWFDIRDQDLLNLNDRGPF